MVLLRTAYETKVKAHMPLSSITALLRSASQPFKKERLCTLVASSYEPMPLSGLNLIREIVSRFQYIPVLRFKLKPFLGIVNS